MASEQSRYQVRFDWGAAGAHAIADDADVIVWVDAIGSSLDVERLPAGPAVIEADFPVAAAAARWVSVLQKRLGRRIAIAIVAAGEQRGGGDIRFAVEDQLAAGAIIDRLARAGLDATSPEAAAAEGAYRHLERAVGHLLTASVTATARKDKLSPPMFRVDDELSEDDVVVVRDVS